VPAQSIKSTFSSSGAPIYFFDLGAQAVAPYYGFDASYVAIDHERGIIYDTSGTGAASTAPELTVQLPIHVQLDDDGSDLGHSLENSLLAKLVDLAVHDGVYYGIATEALFNNPRGIAVDNNGNVFVADDEHHTVRKIDATTGSTVIIGLIFESRRLINGTVIVHFLYQVCPHRRHLANLKVWQLTA